MHLHATMQYIFGGYVMRNTQWIPSIALCILLLVTMSGCGGSSSEPSAIPIKFTISWAARARSINAPSSALSAELLLDAAIPGGGQFRYVVNRPDGSGAQVLSYTTTQPVLLGQHAMHMRFYAATNATGAIVGVAGDMVDIKTDGTGIGSVYTEGSVADVSIPEKQTVALGTKKLLALSVRNAAGQLIAVSPGSIYWSVDSGQDKLIFEADQARGIDTGTAMVAATVDSRASRSTAVSVILTEQAMLVPLLPNSADFASNTSEGISSDGKWVCGMSVSGGKFQPYRWRVGQPQAEALGYLPGKTDFGKAVKISADGNVVVGYCSDAEDKDEAFIWRAGQGMTTVPGMPEDAISSQCEAVSADGLTVGGYFKVYDENNNIDQYGFMWSDARGFGQFMDLQHNPDQLSCSVISITPNGNAAIMEMAWDQVGVDFKYQPVIWRAGSGLQTLGGYDATTPNTRPNWMSADTTVVVGLNYTSTGSFVNPARWGASMPWMLLRPDKMTEAACASQDGQRIFGGGANGGDAFLWEPGQGYRNLLNILMDRGLIDSLEGGSPAKVNSCSDDGGVMCGTSRKDADTRGFVLVLPR